VRASTRRCPSRRALTAHDDGQQKNPAQKKSTNNRTDLDLGTRVATKHIRDVSGPSGLAAFAHEHVGGSKPLLIDGALDDWPAYGGGGEAGDAGRQWTPANLLRREGDALVTLTVTPDGRADAVRALDDGKGEHFVLPHEERVPLRRFLRPDGRLAHEGGGGDGDGDGDGAKEGGAPARREPPPAQVRYLSSQNGCLAAELPRLLPDLLSPDEAEVEEEQEQAGDGAEGDDANVAKNGLTARERRAAGGPAWARAALSSGGRPAEAVNVWIGCRRSETSVHRDPYENLFAVLRGSKTFTLLPPHESFRLGLEPFPAARWRPDGRGGLVAVPEGPPPGRRVLWTALDPSSREGGAELQQQRARYPLFFGGGGGGAGAAPRLPPPIRVTVRAGQMLYLPAFWFHHVTQRGPPGGEEDDGGGGGGRCCISVNWWFETRFGGNYALARFAERLAARAGLVRPLRSLGGDEEDEDDEDEDDEDDN
jgi:jumonji domain-containing protein 7